MIVLLFSCHCAFSKKARGTPNVPAAPCRMPMRSLCPFPVTRGFFSLFQSFETLWRSTCSIWTALGCAEEGEGRALGTGSREAWNRALHCQRIRNTTGTSELTNSSQMICLLLVTCPPASKNCTLTPTSAAARFRTSPWSTFSLSVLPLKTRGRTLLRRAVSISATVGPTGGAARATSAALLPAAATAGSVQC